MIDPILVPYIQKSLKQGHSLESTCEFLANSGHPMTNIQDTVSYMKMKQAMPGQKPADPEIPHSWVFIILPIIIIVGFAIYVYTVPSEDIGETELIDGVDVKLKPGSTVELSISNRLYTLELVSINEIADIKIGDAQTELSLYIPEKLDLDKDGDYDLKLELIVAAKGYATVSLQSYEEITCIPEWECEVWTACDDGYQKRNCTDINRCRSREGRPDIQQPCVMDSCTEDWICSEWTTCTAEGIQTRNCNDQNLCRTTATRPPLQQSCTYMNSCTENWVCGDWGPCTARGTQSRTCTDQNNCRTTDNRPQVSQPCTYSEACTPNWQCTEWGECIDGTQSRRCTDSNACATIAGKPQTSRACSCSLCQPIQGCTGSIAGSDYCCTGSCITCTKSSECLYYFTGGLEGKCYNGDCMQEECYSYLDCQVDDLCFGGLCLTQDNLKSDYTDCTASDECSSMSCTGCATGHPACAALEGETEQGQVTMNLCLECGPQGCAAGFECNEFYRCVPR